MKKRTAALNFVINNAIYIVFLMIFMYFAITEPVFLSSRNLMNIPQHLAFVALIATGMTLVIITGGIDLSVGSIVAFSGVVFAIMISRIDSAGALYIAILIALVAGSFAGTINGFFIVKFKVPPFIATFAMMTIARGMAQLISGNTKIFITPESVSSIQNIVTSSKFMGIPVLVIIMLVIVSFFGVMLFTTRFGRYVIATGGNEEAAKLSGINVGNIKLLCYTIIAMLASVVGIMMACKFSCGNPEAGVMWELHAIAACVVGGTSLMGGKGNVFKTLLGALLIGVLDNGLNIKALSSEMIIIIKGVIILAAVLLDQIKE